MQQPHRPILALGFRLAAAIFVAITFALAKLLGERHVSLPEIVFWRQAVTLPIVVVGMAAAGRLGRLKTRRIGGHMTRALLGTIGMTLSMGAVQALHMSESTTISFTVPLFAVIITALFLQEKVGLWRWLAVGIGFAGVLLVTRPGGMVMPLPGLLMGLAGALTGAIISFHIRQLSTTEAPTTVVFWYALFGTLYASPLLPFFHHAHDGAIWAMLIGLGAISTLSQWLLTSSLRHGSVATVVVMDYSLLLWATLFGWLIWGELPDPRLWLGAPLIVASGLIIFWSGQRQGRVAAARVHL